MTRIDDSVGLRAESVEIRLQRHLAILKTLLSVVVEDRPQIFQMNHTHTGNIITTMDAIITAPHQLTVKMMVTLIRKAMLLKQSMSAVGETHRIFRHIQDITTDHRTTAAHGHHLRLRVKVRVTLIRSVKLLLKLLLSVVEETHRTFQAVRQAITTDHPTITVHHRLRVQIKIVTKRKVMLLSVAEEKRRIFHEDLHPQDTTMDHPAIIMAHRHHHRLKVKVKRMAAMNKETNSREAISRRANNAVVDKHLLQTSVRCWEAWAHKAALETLT